jgi:hypothetical protein
MAIDFSDLGGQPVNDQKGIDFSDLGGVPVGGGQAPAAAPQPQSTFDRLNQSLPGVRRAIQLGLDTVNAPFELAGEAVRGALTDTPFRAPTLATDLGLKANNQYVNTNQPPMNIFSLPRKAIEAGLMGARALPQGVKPALQAAGTELNRTDANPVEALTDVGTALGTGAIAPDVANAPMQAAENLGSKIGSSIVGGAKAGAKKLFSAGTGVSEDAINARLANPSAIENAAPVSDLQHKLADSMTTLQNQITEGDNQAWKTLSKSYVPKELGYTSEDRAIPKETVQDILDSVKKDLSVFGGGLVGKSAKQAAATLDDLSNDIDTVGKYSGGKIKSLLGADSAIPKNQFLPETTVKGIIQSLDQNIDWNDPAAGPINNALENARTQLDDILKKQNRAYAKAMEPVADKMNLKADMQKQFGIKSVPGQGFVPGTSTQSNLANVLGNNKSIAQNTLDRLKQHTGDDFLGQVQNAKFNKEFQPGLRAQGSRRTAAGAVIGGAIGKLTGSPTLGAAAGATTGFMMDTQGGPIAAKILDAFSGGSQGLLAPYANQVQKFAPQLIRAMNEGAPSLSVANEELMNRDPDYRQWILNLTAADQAQRPNQAQPIFKQPPKAASIFNKPKNQQLAMGRLPPETPPTIVASARA